MIYNFFQLPMINGLFILRACIGNGVRRQYEKIYQYFFALTLPKSLIVIVHWNFICKEKEAQRIGIGRIVQQTKEETKKAISQSHFYNLASLNNTRKKASKTSSFSFFQTPLQALQAESQTNVGKRSMLDRFLFPHEDMYSTSGNALRRGNLTAAITKISKEKRVFWCQWRHFAEFFSPFYKGRIHFLFKALWAFPINSNKWCHMALFCAASHHKRHGILSNWAKVLKRKKPWIFW